MFTYCDEVVKYLGAIFGIDMTKKHQTLEDIRRNLAAAKKQICQ